MREEREKIYQTEEKIQIVRRSRGPYPPLRDIQQARPVLVCPRCGGEQYRCDQLVWADGGLLCAACAAKREEEECVR